MALIHKTGRKLSPFSSLSQSISFYPQVRQARLGFGYQFSILFLFFRS